MPKKRDAKPDCSPLTSGRRLPAPRSLIGKQWRPIPGKGSSKLPVRRGDFVITAERGGAGKPRPVLVVQSDLFDAMPHVVVLPLSTELTDAPLFRIDIAPTRGNGINRASQIAVDRPFTAHLDKVQGVIGRADDATMLRVGRALALLFGLA